MAYQLDLNKILEDLAIDKGKIQHKSVRTKWLPYTVNFDSNKLHDFSEVIAAFGRLVNHIDHEELLSMENLLERVLKNENLDVSPANRSVLKEILQTLFFTEDGKMNLFHPSILYYLPSSKENEKMAGFLRDVLWDESQRFENVVEEGPTDVMTKLLFESLPPLVPKTESKEGLPYRKVVPEVSRMFMEDYSWLVTHSELYVMHYEKLLTYYYFFYVTQFAITCNELFDASEEKITPIYFNLESESVSQSRTSYLRGWKLIDAAIKKLFTHVNCLEILNHHKDRNQQPLTYREIVKQVGELDSIERQELIKLLNEFLEKYRNVTLPQGTWEQFVLPRRYEEDPVLGKMYELERSIDFQFLHPKSGRKSRYDDYAEWFISFCQKVSLLRSKGRHGKRLILTDDYLLFLTKLVMRDNQKIRLKVLFDEFEKRGILFDRDTQNAVVEYFERINILDKKSDSGDALYVKSFL